MASQRQPREAQTPSSERSFATWPLALTLYMARSIFASGSMTNVDLMTPDVLLAVEVLLAPGAIGLQDLVVGVAEQRKVKPSRSRNFASFSGLSGLIPTT